MPNTLNPSWTKPTETINKISLFTFKLKKTLDSVGMFGLPMNTWLLDLAMSILFILDGLTSLLRTLLHPNQMTMLLLLPEKSDLESIVVYKLLSIMLLTHTNLTDHAPVMINLLFTSETLWSKHTTGHGTQFVMQVAWLQQLWRQWMVFGEVSSQRTAITPCSLTCDDLQRQLIDTI